VQPKLSAFLEAGEIHPSVRRGHNASRPRRRRHQWRLAALVRQGRFRSDLFYRIGVACYELPPSGNGRTRSRHSRRSSDPSATEYGRTGLRLADDLIAALLLYDWPGNIRQLANEIRRVTALAADGQTLCAADLAPGGHRGVEHPHRRPVTSAAPAVDVRLDQPMAQAVADLERSSSNTRCRRQRARR